MTDPVLSPASERRTITVRTPDDILALVPYVLGFQPEESLVLLTTGSQGHPFHARIDLPDHPRGLPQVVRPLVEAAVRNRARAAIVVVFSADATLGDEAFHQLADALAAVRVETAAGLRADGERWFPAGELGGAGTPYDVSGHPLTAAAVLEGKVTYRSRDELSKSLVTADPEADRAVAARCQVEQRRLARVEGLEPLVAEGRWAVSLLAGCLAEERSPDDAELARLLAAIGNVDLRDLLWAELDRRTAARHVRFWSDVVRRSPLEVAAPPCALLAFSAWLAGDGALAWCALDRCHEADPDYSMAALVAQALHQALPPSTWLPFDRRMLPLHSR